MFKEVLQIKPVLEPAATKKMEVSLSQRFGVVSKRFMGGFKNMLKGSLLGLSVGFLAKLLSPLDVLEEKLKTILNQGKDLNELAATFGTDAGSLQQFQDVAASMGIKSEQLTDMMTKFASAVSEAKDEFADPTKEPSQKSMTVRNYMEGDNMLDNFLQFLIGLKKEGMGSGRDVFYSDREQRKAAERQARGETLSDEERARLTDQGLLRRITGKDSRQDYEKQVFGDSLKGSAARLVDNDIVKALEKIERQGYPTTEQLNKAINKTSNLSDVQQGLEAVNKSRDFVNAANKINGGMIQSMERAKYEEASAMTKQFDSYADLRRTADSLEELKKNITELVQFSVKGLGYLAELVNQLTAFSKSRLMQYFKDAK